MTTHDPFLALDKEHLGPLAVRECAHQLAARLLLGRLLAQVVLLGREGRQPPEGLLVPDERLREGFGERAVGDVVVGRACVNVRGGSDKCEGRARRQSEGQDEKGCCLSPRGDGEDGPIPPVETTQSKRSVSLLAASTMSASSSGTTSIRLSSIPSSKQCFAK
jgi:hypothetical protein